MMSWPHLHLLTNLWTAEWPGKMQSLSSGLTVFSKGFMCYLHVPSLQMLLLLTCADTHDKLMPVLMMEGPNSCIMLDLCWTTVACTSMADIPHLCHKVWVPLSAPSNTSCLHVGSQETWPRKYGSNPGMWLISSIILTSILWQSVDSLRALRPRPFVMTRGMTWMLLQWLQGWQCCHWTSLIV